ncbi:MAG TPA: ABC transporter substrate-binding protein [Anaeromyxobacteraceae bacterium]|nr:ABC transporter substrate-binding protein [Anaeromyxobacteraceae bacterium]
MRPTRALALIAAAIALAACEKKQAPQPPAAAAAPAVGPAAGAPIVIGHVGSLTGDDATFGLSTEKGISLAIEDANARGGVKGHLLKLVSYDDKGKSEEAAVVTTRLAVDDKASIILGEVASSRSLAMASKADDFGVPMITPASTNPAVTRDGQKVRPYVFRVCFLDTFQGLVMAKFARETLKLSRVAILRDVGSAYSVGLADEFLARFRALGGTVVDDQSFKAGDQDFKAQLTAIRGKKPDGVFVPGYYTQVALIVRQARELGLRQPFMGGDGWDSEKLFEIGGRALDGNYYSNHYTPEDPKPAVQTFVRRFKEKYGSVPDTMAALGFDAANVAVDAMARAGDLSGSALRDAIAATKDYPGVTGGISIDAGHDAVKAAVVLKIEGGAPRLAATFAPEAAVAVPPSPASPAK